MTAGNWVFITRAHDIVTVYTVLWESCHLGKELAGYGLLFDPVSSSLIATVKLSVSGGASRRFLSYLIMTGAIPPSPSTTTQNARADPIVTDEDEAVI